VGVDKSSCLNYPSDRIRGKKEKVISFSKKGD